MNSHSTCQNGFKQATISGTSKHCRSVFDGRSDLETRFRFGHPTPPNILFPFPGPHPRTCQAGVEGLLSCIEKCVAILSWIYETNRINQLPATNCMPSVLCLLSQKQKLLQLAHNKHKASCSQPTSVEKNCSETRTGESTITLLFCAWSVTLCISRALVFNNTRTCCTLRSIHQPMILSLTWSV